MTDPKESQQPSVVHMASRCRHEPVLASRIDDTTAGQAVRNLPTCRRRQASDFAAGRTGRTSARRTMKQTFFAVLIVALSASSAHAQQARAIVSPDVLPDGRVTFRLNAPKADEVMLSGEFLDKPRSFTRDADGVWSVTVGPIAPEVYHYNFTIDGVTIDPSNPQLKTGSTASTITSVLEIRHPSPAFYDAQPVPHGDIRTHWYHSKSLDSVRRLTVYTPPGYDKDRSSRYPVLYLFHGANADENAWYRLGRANLILDHLLDTGKIQPFIVVMRSDTACRRRAPGENPPVRRLDRDSFPTSSRTIARTTIAMPCIVVCRWAWIP